MTKEEAIALAETKWWEKTTPEEAAMFQLHEPLLCMPFGKFHEGVEKLLGRSVWTHEFAYAENLREEAEGKRPRPTMQDVLNLVPDKKLVVASVGE